MFLSFIHLFNKVCEFIQQDPALCALVTAEYILLICLYLKHITATEKSKKVKELNNSEFSSYDAYVGQSKKVGSCPGIGQFRQLKRVPIVISETVWMICQSLSIAANLDNNNFNEIKNKKNNVLIVYSTAV
ncbi:hypothetical protein CDAR_34681 [Caerostris darwini]|uniref:Uncharacterized protein n=1 Tax=Caerostris darwini TaxID=1538125 RepID=A0AAV4SUE8_9ARAC|nr:hypothetical protein CDAR_34681 [Caerostris darwini]